MLKTFKWTRIFKVALHWKSNVKMCHVFFPSICGLVSPEQNWSHDIIWTSLNAMGIILRECIHLAIISLLGNTAVFSQCSVGRCATAVASVTFYTFIRTRALKCTEETMFEWGLNIKHTESKYPIGFWAWLILSPARRLLIGWGGTVMCHIWSHACQEDRPVPSNANVSESTRCPRRLRPWLSPSHGTNSIREEPVH